MDQLDLAILRELTQWGSNLVVLPVGKPQSVGVLSRKVGASEGTVRKRIARLRTSGFLKGVRLLPNPGLLGLELGAFGLLLSSRLPRTIVIDQISAIDGVFVVQEHYGPQLGVCVISRGEEDLARKTRAILRFAEEGSLMYTRMLLPPPDVVPALRDWEILLHLLKHGPQPYVTMSHALNLSTRTLMRRVAALTRSNAIVYFINFDFGAIWGGMPADLILTFRSGESREEAERQLLRLADPYLLYAGRWESISVYWLVIPNSLTATKLEGEAAETPGVQTARVELVNRHIEPPGVLVDYFERAIALQVRPPGAALTRARLRTKTGAPRHGGTRTSESRYRDKSDGNRQPGSSVPR